MELITLDVEPTTADVTLFKQQYERALNGLYEAWKFGEMMRVLKLRMEDGLGVLTRENAETERAVISTGNRGITGGWNAGLGLKTWLKLHAPEVNYKTAMRFLAIAETVRKALPEEADETMVREHLAGKSARSLLGGKRDGAGRKRAVPDLGSDAAVAWQELEEPLAALNELVVVQRRFEVLSETDLQTLREAFALLLQTVNR